jgi:putative ABC transport system permease protein
MNPWRLICRNILFFRKQNIGIMLAAALCAVVLTGALTVGDSVRSTLADLAHKRLGKGEAAILSADGFFQENLAERIQKSLMNPKIMVAPVVLTRGTLSTPDGSLRVNNIQVLGVDDRFWRLAPEFQRTPMGKGPFLKPKAWHGDSFWVNRRMGHRLSKNRKERFILRMEEPSLFSRDAPMSGERENEFVTMNQKLGEVVPPEGFGSFGLHGNQREPLTIFVSLEALQRKLFRTLGEESGNTQFANFLLMGGLEGHELDMASVKVAMDKSWSLSDAGIEIKELNSTEEWGIRTRQVFLSDKLTQKAKGLSKESSGVFTYLVNSIEKKADKNESARIPYSMMTAVEPEHNDFLGDRWGDDDIAVNEWAARDLNVTLGESVCVSYYTVGERRKLIESSREFVLKKILPMPDPIPDGQESDWTPRFPGLHDAESCGEWDTGIPIVHEIRPKDEDYWDRYRGTPKAFVSLKAGQSMWGNRWGSLTGIRIGKSEGEVKEIATRLRQNLQAEDAGLLLRDLKADASKSTDSPVDFSQLFLGFSCFVILAALAITAMLFTFSIEQRSEQVGLLRALGFKSSKIRLVFWGEGLLAALLGSVIGSFVASAYGKIILNLLGGHWSGAVSGASFQYDPAFASIINGGVVAAFICFLAMIWSTRKLLQRRPQELLQAGIHHISSDTRGMFRYRKRYQFVGILCLLFSLSLSLSVGLTSSLSSMAFFGAGAFVLLGGLFWLKGQFSGGATHQQGISKISELNQRNMGRRAGRSLVTIGSMAAGTFLVVSTGAFRKTDSLSTENLKSGTGGFTYWGESATPIYDDLNAVEGMELYDLNESLLKNAQVIPLRLREGDDASCLNLNKALRPKIYGVKPSDYKDRFQFASGNWSDLVQARDGDAVPAIVDQNTLMWALKKSIGDRLQFLGSDGVPFEIELVGALKGSILQGALIIKEEDFLTYFTQQGGYRSFMIAGKKDDAQKIAIHLEDRLYRHGIEFRETGARLDELNQVENAYLSIFQGLGGLGMLIATVGIGLVVTRNLLERSHEFALFEALGYSLTTIRKYVFSEHAKLAIWGIALGAVSAVIGIAPALVSEGMERPSFNFVWFFVAMAVLAFLWIGVAVYSTLRKSQIHFLRNE